MHMYNYIYIYHLGIHTCIYTQCMHTYIYIQYIYSIHVHIYMYMHIYTCTHCMGYNNTTCSHQPTTNDHTHTAQCIHIHAVCLLTYTILYNLPYALCTNHRSLPLFGINRASIKACIGPVLALYPCHSNLQAQAGRKQADRPCTTSISLLIQYTWA